MYCVIRASAPSVYRRYDTNEVEQSFALLAVYDFPDNCYVEIEGLTECSCFQIQVDETECL